MIRGKNGKIAGIRPGNKVGPEGPWVVIRIARQIIAKRRSLRCKISAPGRIIHHNPDPGAHPFL